MKSVRHNGVYEVDWDILPCQGKGARGKTA